MLSFKRSHKRAIAAWTHRAAPYAVLAITLLLTLLVSYGAHLFSSIKERARFDQTAEQERQNIQRSMKGYLVLIDGLRGLANAKVSMTRDQFYEYVDSLQLPQNYPAVQGLGFAMRANGPVQKADLIAKITDLGDESFHIWPETGKPPAFPVVYLGPQHAANQELIGFDLLTESVRFAALLRAVEMGQAATSALVPPIAGVSQHDGEFLIFAPLYTNGVLPVTREERIQQAWGCVFCPFRIETFFGEASGLQTHAAVRVQVYDSVEPNGSSLLFDSGGKDEAGIASAAPRFSATSTLQIADRTWNLVFSTKPEFTAGAATNLAPFTLAGGTAISLLLFGLTLAQSKARFAAEHNAAEFRASFYLTAVGQAQVRPDTGVYIRVNPSFCEITGYSEAELLEMTFVELTHPEERDSDADDHKRMIEGEFEVIRVEKRYIHKNGKIVWVNVSSSLVRGEGGRPLRTLAVIQDITARKEAEAALQSVESRFRRLVEQSIVGTYVIQNDRFAYVNPKMEEIFGFSAEELMAAPVTDFVFNEDRSLVSGNVDKRIKGVVETLHYSVRGVRKDGALIDIEAHGGRIEFNDAPAILGTLLDITKRKRAEQEIQKLNIELEQRVCDRTAELEALNKELESFSYSVSHDLRAPLRHIQGYTEILTKALTGSLTDKSAYALKAVSDSSIEMGKLIDDLLAFSRMGKVGMKHTRVSLDALVQQTIQSLASATQDRQIEWQISPLPDVLGDTALLKQVLVNLLDNAVKYTRQKELGRIEISTVAEENGNITVCISDNGAGFDMRYADKLFSVFQRLHRAEDFEGTGIGLAIVSRIIARHGGRTWAEGKLNEGATFFFTLKPFEAHHESVSVAANTAAGIPASSGA